MQPYGYERPSILLYFTFPIMSDQLTFYARVHMIDLITKEKKTPQSAQKTYCSAVILRALPRSLFRSCIRVRALPGTRSVQCSCVVISSTQRQNARNIRFIPPPVLKKKSNGTNVPVIGIELVFLTHIFEVVLLFAPFSLPPSPCAAPFPFPHNPVLLLFPTSKLNLLLIQSVFNIKLYC